MQLSFTSRAKSLADRFVSAGLALAVLAGHQAMALDRKASEEAHGTVELAPFRLGGELPPGWQLGAAWRLVITDRRLHGLSGLDFEDEGETMLMVSDRGWLFAFDPPRQGQKELDYVVAPLSGSGTRDGDAEAVIATDGGPVVAFETRHRVEWLDRSLDVRKADPLPAITGRNVGIEGLAAWRGSYLALSETGKVAFDGEGREYKVRGSPAALTGAAVEGDRLWLLFRSFGLRGFRARIANAWVDGDVVSVGKSEALPLSPLDNAEGLAVRRRADGTREVWIVTDDNQRAPQRTIIVRYDVEEGAWPDLRPAKRD